MQARNSSQQELQLPECRARLILWLHMPAQPRLTPRQSALRVRGPHPAGRGQSFCGGSVVVGHVKGRLRHVLEALFTAERHVLDHHQGPVW